MTTTTKPLVVYGIFRGTVARLVAKFEGVGAGRADASPPRTAVPTLGSPVAFPRPTRKSGRASGEDVGGGVGSSGDHGDGRSSSRAKTPPAPVQSDRRRRNEIGCCCRCCCCGGESRGPRPASADAAGTRGPVARTTTSNAGRRHLYDFYVFPETVYVNGVAYVQVAATRNA